MTKTSNKEILIVPTSKVLFMALAKPVKGFQTEELKYTIRVEVDGSTKEGQELKAKIKDINPNRIIALDKDKNALPNGNFRLTFSSKFPVNVFDKTGQQINQEDVPRLGSDGSATARLEVVVDYSRPNLSAKAKGAMYLTGVALIDVTAGSDSKTTDTEARIQALLGA